MLEMASIREVVKRMPVVRAMYCRTSRTGQTCRQLFAADTITADRRCCGSTGAADLPFACMRARASAAVSGMRLLQIQYAESAGGVAENAAIGALGAADLIFIAAAAGAVAVDGNISLIIADKILQCAYGETHFHAP